MKKISAIFIVGIFVIAPVTAGENLPVEPTTAQVAALLGIDEKLIKEIRLPEHPTTKRFAKWVANYEISGKKPSGLTITLYPNDRIFRVDNLSRYYPTGLTKVIESEIKKITMPDGDEIYHRFADLGSDGATFLAELINHENDWDFAIVWDRESGVDQAKFPIADGGLKLVPKIEKLLRNQTQNDKPEIAPSPQPQE